jgi:hypothetical protein
MIGCKGGREAVAEYLLFVYEDEERTSTMEPAAEAALVDEFQEFIARNKAVLRRAQRLYPTSAATSVRHEPDGGVRITDGAFIESKEVVAGFFLIECDDLGAALDVAKQIPVPHGGVEIRPVRPRPDA